jgi:urease accessory protein
MTGWFTGTSPSDEVRRQDNPKEGNLMDVHRDGGVRVKSVRTRGPVPRLVSLCALLAMTLTGTAAWAHGGGPSAHGVGFLAGFLHPLSGFDHLLVALGLGVLLSRSSGPARPVTVAALALGLIAGTFAARSALEWYGVESMIAFSCVFIGVLLLHRGRMTSWRLVPLALACGLVHGHAHGAEGPDGAGYVLGLVLGTLVLLQAASLGTRALAAQRTADWLRRGLASLLLGSGALALVSG